MSQSSVVSSRLFPCSSVHVPYVSARRGKAKFCLDFKLVRMHRALSIPKLKCITWSYARKKHFLWTRRAIVLGLVRSSKYLYLMLGCSMSVALVMSVRFSRIWVMRRQVWIFPKRQLPSRADDFKRSFPRGERIW